MVTLLKAGDPLLSMSKLRVFLVVSKAIEQSIRIAES